MHRRRGHRESLGHLTLGRRERDAPVPAATSRTSIGPRAGTVHAPDRIAPAERLFDKFADTLRLAIAMRALATTRCLRARPSYADGRRLTSTPGAKRMTPAYRT